MTKKIKIGYQMHLLSIPYLLWLNSIQNEFILWVYKQKRQPRRGSGPLSQRCTASLLLDALSRPTDCPRCCSEKRCAAFFKVRCRKKARATISGNEVMFAMWIRVGNYFFLKALCARIARSQVRATNPASFQVSSGTRSRRSPGS